MTTAIRHPQLAARLVLADCGAAFSDQGRAAFKGMSAAAKEKGLGAIADVAMRRLFSPEFQQQNPALTEARKVRFLAVDPQTFHGACEALATLDLRPQLSGVTVPVLVLVGEQDEATPPPMSVELNAGLPNARLVLLPGLAHVPQLQAPEVFLAARNNRTERAMSTGLEHGDHRNDGEKYAGKQFGNFLHRTPRPARQWQTVVARQGKPGRQN